MSQPGVASCTSRSSSTALLAASSGGGSRRPWPLISFSMHWTRRFMTGVPPTPAISSITAIAVRNMCRCATRNGWRTPGSSRRWEAAAIRTTNALAESVIGLFKTEVIRRKGPWRHHADGRDVRPRSCGSSSTPPSRGRCSTRVPVACLRDSRRGWPREARDDQRHPGAVAVARVVASNREDKMANHTRSLR